MVIMTKVAGVDVAEFSTHSLLANVKFIVPTWRLQPYFAPGVGAQKGDFDGEGILAALDDDHHQRDLGHHRQGEHGSFASCRGKAPLDIVWRLGQPGMSRWYRNELRT